MSSSRSDVVAQFQVCFKKFEECFYIVLRVFKGCFKGVLKKFQGVSRKLQGSLRAYLHGEGQSYLNFSYLLKHS